MPFEKIGPNRYRSPSGRIFTRRQVIGYYASDGFRRPVRKPARKPYVHKSRTRG